MSIITEALKKAEREHGAPLLSVQKERPLSRALEIQQARPKKKAVNWGPIFVLAVLFLITGPILAPLFSSPFKREPAYRFDTSAPRATFVAAVPEERRPAQFAVEEAVRPIPSSPLAGMSSRQPRLELSGVVTSPQGSYCILNGRIVKEGDALEGVRLVKVSPEEVTLDYRGEKIILPVD